MVNGVFFTCDCGSEILRVELNDWSEVSKDFWISIYEKVSLRFPLWTRFRNALHVLRFGRPHPDQVILDKDKAVELANWIIEMSKKEANDEDGSGNP